ncbi:Queuosine biosynthesis protein QueC [Bartonella choladocola]|uniref:7-cyano-7-deazaguanine synthase QueC n=1 Tax=Bartonella choladocola TaxID=2750995 RepID=UPI003997FEFF
MKTYLICSGGLDSVTLAYRLTHEKSLQGIISFDYGQRHKKELFFAKECARALGADYYPIDISAIGKNLSGSSLTDNIDVPDGYYAEDNMKSTVVPNRNAVFLSIAFAIASAKHGDSVAIAVHGGDHFIYADCRENFINAFNAMEQLSLEGQCQLFAPYVSCDKSDIVKDGVKYSVPFTETWSCYKGGEHHCGRCGTCVERREAFALAGVDDPTIYEDNEFWIEAVKRNKNSKLLK